MSPSSFECESIRVDIDNAISSPDAALAFLRKYGATIRDMVVDPATSEIEDERDEAYADANAAEKKATGYEEAFDKLMEAVDQACDDLGGGKVYDKLFASSSHAAEMVKGL